MVRQACPELAEGLTTNVKGTVCPEPVEGPILPVLFPAFLEIFAQHLRAFYDPPEVPSRQPLPQQRCAIRTLTPPGWALWLPFGRRQSRRFPC